MNNFLIIYVGAQLFIFIFGVILWESSISIEYEKEMSWMKFPFCWEIYTWKHSENYNIIGRIILQIIIVFLFLPWNIICLIIGIIILLFIGLKEIFDLLFIKRGNNNG